jgi:nitrate reductase gamma subunit
MSLVFSLLLPIIATAILFRGYPERAARGQAPAQLTTGSAVAKGALTGASALVFLGILGVLTLAYRGKTVTPIEVPAVAFWTSQFLIAALLGAVLGALSALALLPWVRRRLAQSTPASPPSSQSE